MFRGTRGNFFYKGFFYLGIGIFFYLFSKPSIKNGFIILIIYVALFLTLLRWLLAIVLVIFTCTIFFNWAIQKFKISFLKSRQMVFHLMILCVMILIPVIFKNFYITTLGNKQESVDIRKQQFDQVSAQIFSKKKLTVIPKTNKNEEVVKTSNKFNFIYGKGLGIGVPIRPVHMELTYLEIFFKQGILGLSFWFFIFFYCVFHFWKAWKNHVDLNIILPWITGVLVIYLQSITNPLLVNSIGMSFVILAMLFLRNKSKITQEN
jgi:O-antigen ligase